MLKSIALCALMMCALTANADVRFPSGPDESLTPGVLCTSGRNQRYAEKINYCDRNVSSRTKAEVFRLYDQIGYRTRTMKRQDFKIDHYIPLCAGGSNDIKNLWPQHVSVYRITDGLEQTVCEKMAAGRLSQKRGVAFIVEAKNNLDRAAYIIRVVRDL